MELSYEILKEGRRVGRLNVVGRLDGSNYTQLVEKARDLLAGGSERIILDLSGCTYLSSAGLFALHNIALMAHKIDPLDQEDGWGALRSMANDKRSLQDMFKIVNVPDKIMHSLEISGLSPLYATYPDIKGALAAFDLIQ
jgi:anti-anti-sigma regulatory factor